MELALIAESPNAFKTANEAMLAGEGASLLALSQTTAIAPQELTLMWQAALDATDPVQDEASASRFMIRFLVEIGPHLQVNTTQLANFLWQLSIEDHTGLTAQQAQGHRWLSRWLKTSPDTVSNAVKETFAQQTLGEQDLRQRIHDDPAGYLRALSIAIERQDGDKIQARVNAIVENNASLFSQPSAPLTSPG